MPLVDTVEVTLTLRGVTYTRNVTNAAANSLVTALDVASKQYAELLRYVELDAAEQERLREERAKGRRRLDKQPEGE